MKKDQKINETAEKRLQIIIPLINCDKADKALFTQIAKDNDISVRTLRRWLDAYKKHKINGLIPQYKGSSTVDRKYISFNEALEKAVAMRMSDPCISVRNIILALESENENLKGILKRSTLQQHLLARHCGKRDLAVLKQTGGRRFFGRFHKKHIMENIQCDVKEFPKGMLIDANGSPCSAYIQICVDNCSRRILAYKVSTDQQSHIVLDCLKDLISKYGIPKSLHLDNGLIYRSRIIKRACKLLDIKIHYCKPYAGYEKGVVERINSKINDLENQVKSFNGTMKFEGFCLLCDEWIRRYNQTVHGILKDDNDKPMTPDEYFQRYYVCDKPIGDDILSYVFIQSDCRKLGKDGTISYKGKTYSVETKDMMPGDEVELLIESDGTIKQVLPNYETVPIKELCMNSFVSKPKVEENEEKQPADCTYVLSILREHQKKLGNYKDEESFKAWAMSMLFADKDKLHTGDIGNPIGSNQSLVADRGMNDYSPFADMEI